MHRIHEEMDYTITFGKNTKIVLPKEVSILKKKYTMKKFSENIHSV